MNLSNRPLAFGSLLLIAMALLAAPSRVQAFGGPPGGPFGNGSYFPTEGTFQATIRAMNLSGVATFNSNGGAGKDTPASSQESGQARTETAGQASTGGTFAVSYQGSTYTGNVDGSINPSGGSIAAVLEGSSGTSSAGGNGTSTPTTVVNTLDSVFGVIGTRDVDGGTRVQVVQEEVYEILDGGTRLETVDEQRVIVLAGGTVVSPDPQSTSTTDRTTVTITETDPQGNTTTKNEVTDNTTSVTTNPLISLPSTTQNVTETVSRVVNNPSTIETFTVNNSVILDNPDTVADDFGWIDTVATSTFVDSLYASGYFNARLKNSFPNQVFKGDGAMSFSQVNETAVPPVLEMVDVPINVRGVRISNSSQNYTAKTVQKPTVVTSTVVENRPKPGTP